MRNTWIQSLEAQSVEGRMLHEDAILLNYFNEEASVMLETRIKEISQAVLNEFWTPEAFGPDHAFAEHMMHWKGLIESSIPRQTYYRVMNTYEEGSLFKCVLMELLDQLEFYNKFYTDLFFNPECRADDGTLLFTCNCPACNCNC